MLSIFASIKSVVELVVDSCDNEEHDDANLERFLRVVAGSLRRR